ncbi:hypothetical protein AAMO2058_000955800 [Amorphochlora amoebiformis]
MASGAPNAAPKPSFAPPSIPTAQKTALGNGTSREAPVAVSSVKNVEFPKSLTFQLASVRIGEFIVQENNSGIGKGLLARHKGKPPISGTFHFTPGKGKVVWQFGEKGSLGGKKLRVSIKFSNIVSLCLDRATWNLVVETSAPPFLMELKTDGKKQKWVKSTTDFTQGNSKAKRFHVVKAHALGLAKVGEAIAYYELFEGEKYGKSVKSSIVLPDVDPGFRLKGRAAKRKIPSTIPDFKPIEKRQKSVESDKK